MKNRRFKILSFFLIILFIFAAQTFQSAASSKPENRVSVSVKYGYDNYSKFYRSTPVFVTIKNNGSAISGEIRISFRGTDTRKTSYSKNFSLVSEQTDTFVINTCSIPSYTNVLIEVFDDDERLIYSKNDISLNKNTHDIFAGILTESSQILNYLNEIVFYSESYGTYNAMRLIDLGASKALDFTESLSTFDLIFIGEYDISKLSDMQLDALSEWIYDGGTLITGPACQYTYLWKSLSLTPYFLDADETVVATDFSVAGMPQNYLKSPLSWEALNENSTEEEISSIRYGQTNLSIGNRIVKASPIEIGFYEDDQRIDSDFVKHTWSQSANYGHGLVISTNFKYDSEVFASWSGSSLAMYQLLCEHESFVDNLFTDGYDEFPSYYMAQSLLPNSISVEDFSLEKYVFILVVYILIICPVIYVLLKKNDKRHYVWIIVPLLSVLALCFIYIVSDETRKNEPFLNQATTITYSDDSAREEVTLCAIFPEKGQFHLDIPDIYRMRWFYIDDTMRYTYLPYFSMEEEIISSDRYDIHYGEGNHSAAITINNASSFSEWYFNCTRDYLTSENVYIKMNSSEGSYDITVINHTKTDLDYSGIFIGNQLIPLGPIASGKTIHITDIKPEILNDPSYSSEYLGITKLLEVQPSEQNIDADKSQALTMIYNEREGNNSSRPVYFAGISMNYQSNALRDTLWQQYGALLVTKSVDITYEIKDNTIIIPHISALANSVLFDEKIYAGENIEITYTLPDDFALTDAIIEGQNAAKVLMFNYETLSYDDISALKRDDHKTLSAYVSDQVIQLRYENNSYVFDKQPIIPNISLKGVPVSDLD